MVRTLDKVLLENASRLCDNVTRRGRGEKVLTHVPTGFKSIDDKFGGVRFGVATELLAHTGDGKSAFLRQLAEGGAKAGAGVLWIVAEDPEDATSERQFAADTGIDTTEIGRLDLSDPQLKQIQQSALEAGKWAKRILPIYDAQDVESVFQLIDDTRVVGDVPLSEVIIDYAQVLGQSRNLEDDIAKLGQGLHERSRITESNPRKLATVIASQVSNDAQKDGRDAWYKNRDITRIRPPLNSTEWCRQLEKKCKAIWSLVRPGRWLREFGEDAQDDYAELHVIKANFGPMGWAELGWDGPTCSFRNK